MKTTQESQTIERQKTAIRDYILLGLKIDPFDAIRKFGCTKISTRLGEMERDGQLPRIYRGWKKVKTRYGSVKVREYSINPKSVRA